MEKEVLYCVVAPDNSHSGDNNVFGSDGYFWDEGTKKALGFRNKDNAEWFLDQLLANGVACYNNLNPHCFEVDELSNYTFSDDEIEIYEEIIDDK